MGKVKIRRFDPAEFLESDEAVAEYLTAALETDDPAFVTDALGVIARARGMAGIAEKAGLGRESLYKALSAEGHPEFATVLKVAKALGLHLAAYQARSGPIADRMRSHTYGERHGSFPTGARGRTVRNREGLRAARAKKR